MRRYSIDDDGVRRTTAEEALSFRQHADWINDACCSGAITGKVAFNECNRVIAVLNRRLNKYPHDILSLSLLPVFKKVLAKINLIHLGE